MDRGLWAWSRHPNYFGEFSFWVSLALFGVAVSPSDAWWLCLGALGMLGMFLGGSIPMMETRSLERRPEYQDVIDRVSEVRASTAAAGLAGGRVGLAVRRRAGELVPVVDDPSVDDVLDGANAGNPVDRQRDSGTDRC